MKFASPALYALTAANLVSAQFVTETNKIDATMTGKAAHHSGICDKKISPEMLIAKVSAHVWLNMIELFVCPLRKSFMLIKYMNIYILCS